MTNPALGESRHFDACGSGDHALEFCPLGPDVMDLVNTIMPWRNMHDDDPDVEYIWHKPRCYAPLNFEGPKFLHIDSPRVVADRFWAHHSVMNTFTFPNWDVCE